MLSPLFEGTGFFDDSWEMTAFQREAAALTEMNGFWAEVESEVQEYNIVAPAFAELDEQVIDWSLNEEQHKDKLVHHDCMWAGLCEDKVHPDNTWTEDEEQETVQSAAPGKSLLLVKRMGKPPKENKPPAPVRRPDTPSSPDDDEPPQFRHQVDLASTARKIFSRREDATSTVEQDHTYTLSKSSLHASSYAKYAKMDSLGVQTPSDSEEEIDVVSVGDKTAQTGAVSSRQSALPYVPSMLDRHNIQRTVASAMAPNTRKRQAPITVEPPRKKGKGPRRHYKRRSSPDSDSDLENTDIEKRSLHNDMERMRRIGLKNLFDQLKLQVPATRDKERAPKVVILREAAALCKRLQAQDREYEMEKKKQTRLIAKLKKLRMTMAPMYRKLN